MPEEIKVDLDLDLKGLFCPVPKDTVLRNIAKVEVGGVIRATTSDHHSLECIPAWVGTEGSEIMKIDNKGSEFVFYVKRLK